MVASAPLLGCNARILGPCERDVGGEKGPPAPGIFDAVFGLVDLETDERAGSGALRAERGDGRTVRSHRADIEPYFLCLSGPIVHGEGRLEVQVPHESGTLTIDIDDSIVETTPEAPEAVGFMALRSYPVHLPPPGLAPLLPELLTLDLPDVAESAYLHVNVHGRADATGTVVHGGVDVAVHFDVVEEARPWPGNKRITLVGYLMVPVEDAEE